MDPEATLQSAERALKRGDKSTAYEYLEYYTEWRQGGGFEPERGDERASEIWEIISDEYGEDPHGYEEHYEGYDGNPKTIKKLKAKLLR